MRDQLISVIIADRPYRVSVKSEEEEQRFREAGKLIKEKMTEYAQAYSFRDTQDILAILALQFVVESLTMSNSLQDRPKLLEQLTLIEQLLDDCLKEANAH
ncbi:MAG TPA: hypothetical protein DCM62_02825 [Bacteroidales bacterium]|nr:hypothetical protein [Bacteroidales bacterium]